MSRMGFKTKAIIEQDKKDVVKQIQDDKRGFDNNFKEETVKRMMQLGGMMQSPEFNSFPPEHQSTIRNDFEYYKKVKDSFLV